MWKNTCISFLLPSMRKENLKSLINGVFINSILEFSSDFGYISVDSWNLVLHFIVCMCMYVYIICAHITIIVEWKVCLQCYKLPTDGSTDVLEILMCSFVARSCCEKRLWGSLRNTPWLNFWMLKVVIMWRNDYE